MALDLENMSLLHYVNKFSLWHYRSDDESNDQIMTGGYFNNAAHVLRRGDMLIVNTRDDCILLFVSKHNGLTVTVRAVRG